MTLDDMLQAMGADVGLCPYTGLWRASLVRGGLQRQPKYTRDHETPMAAVLELYDRWTKDGAPAFVRYTAGQAAALERHFARHDEWRKQGEEAGEIPKHGQLNAELAAVAEVMAQCPECGQWSAVGPTGPYAVPAGEPEAGAAVIDGPWWWTDGKGDANAGPAGCPKCGAIVMVESECSFSQAGGGHV